MEKEKIQIELNGYSYIFDLKSRRYEDGVITNDTTFLVSTQLRYHLKGIEYLYESWFEIFKWRFIDNIRSLRSKIQLCSNNDISGWDMVSYGREYLGTLSGAEYPIFDFYFSGKDDQFDNKIMFEIKDHVYHGFFSKEYDPELEESQGIEEPKISFESVFLFYEDVMKILDQFEELCNVPSKEYEYWKNQVKLNPSKSNKKEVLNDIFNKLYMDKEYSEKFLKLISSKEYYSPIEVHELVYIPHYLLDRGFDYLDDFMIKLYKLYMYAIELNPDYKSTLVFDGPYFKVEQMENDFFRILDMIESDEFKQDKYLNQFSIMIKEELKKFVKYRR